MLTPSQLAARKLGIGASDAPKIMSGDWYPLWAEKTGRAEPEDLTWVFPVQLGSVTEELNLRFAEHTLGCPIGRRGEAVVSSQYPFMRCTLDGATDTHIVEAKHVNGFSKIEDVRARYVPQTSHQMIVCGMKSAILSVIIGTSEPVLEYIDLDEFFANEYVEKCREFWQHVIDDAPPAQGAPVDAPPVPPEKMRTVDMTGDNTWAAAAADWVANKDGAKLFEAAQKTLKSKIDADVCRASGHGVEINRSKAGSLLIKRS